MISISTHWIPLRVESPVLPPFLVAGVYGPPYQEDRQVLWDFIISAACQNQRQEDLSWLLMGDFNQVLHPSRRLSSCSKILGAEAFLAAIQEGYLVDLKPVGKWFTWTNNREGLVNV